MPFDLAVVIPTILRPELPRALASVHAQDFEGSVQIMLGVDGVPGGVAGGAMLDRIRAACPAHQHLTVLDLGYSTGPRDGGLYQVRAGGSLRTVLSYAANARHIAFLDDDNWWAPHHLSDLRRAIEGHDWAFSLRWYVDPRDDAPVCIDEWESLGPGRGVYADQFGGFVDTNCLMIDKLACHWLLPAWSMIHGDQAASEDRVIFDRLTARGAPGETGQATVYYVYHADNQPQIDQLRAHRKVSSTASTGTTSTPPPATAALYYESEGYDTSGARLMGRHAAGEGFLRAMARFGRDPTLAAVAGSQAQFDDFTQRVGAAAPGRATRWIAKGRFDGLRDVGCLFFPGPIDPPWLWARRAGSQRDFSLCGVTHTTASRTVMQTLGQYLIAPFQSWDALICTSRAVRDMVRGLHENYGAYLAERLCGGRSAMPNLPIIPLGVDCDFLTPDTAAKERGRLLRARNAIPDAALVVLFVGRLSFHAKAHPLPIFLALEEVARRAGRPIVLLFAGWFANEAIERQFRDGAKRYCPSVKVGFLDGRDAQVRRDVWHAADIFTSPSDNIQETFGLTPVEAMAAGLPCVVSDWNGYRDSLTHGEEGFLAPTWQPPIGAGEILARRHDLGLDDYDHYVGHASQFTAVEVPAMVEAFAALVGNDNLRRDMGAKALARARRDYDWPVIIARYEDLWGELAARRAHDEEIAAPRAGSPTAPLSDDPLRLFAGYPSAVLEAETRVRRVAGADPALLRERAGLFMNAAARAFMSPLEVAEDVLASLEENEPQSVAALCADVAEPGDSAPFIRLLAWMAKLGLLRFENEI